MGSDEERLEEMLKAVMEEENQREAEAAQRIQNAAEDADVDMTEMSEMPELSMDDFSELPLEESSVDTLSDMTEMPDMPELSMDDFSDLPAEELPMDIMPDMTEMSEMSELSMDDFSEMPELPVEEVPMDMMPDMTEMPEMPELSMDDFSELPLEESPVNVLPEMPDMPELSIDDFLEMPDMPELSMDDFLEMPAEDAPMDMMPEMPELSMDDFPEMPEQNFEEPQTSPAREMSVDPLKLLAMSEEEIDKVLEEEAALGGASSGKMSGGELSGLLEENYDLSNENDDLADIQQLLQMSDEHVLVDESGMGGDIPFGASDREDMQSLLGEISGMEEENFGDLESEPEKESGRQKKERKKKKEKEKKKEVNGEKKGGLGKKLAETFFGPDDDDLEEEIREEKGKGKKKAADAGGGEEEKGKKKKEKKKKPPKKEKEKDPAKEAKKKLQKEKKAEKAKIKAEKAEKAAIERRAAKKLPKKKVFVWVLLCASIGAGILLINTVGIATIQLAEARNAFEDKDFATAYKLMNGRNLSEEDQLIFGQSSAILHLQHAEEAYENHLKMEKPLKALEDLLKGVEKYQKLLRIGAVELITPELTEEYRHILDILQERYGLSEAGALEINRLESDYQYSLQLEALVNGETYQSQAEIQLQQEEAAQAFPELEDLLPEEEEYLNDSGD